MFSISRFGVQTSSTARPGVCQSMDTTMPEKKRSVKVLRMYAFHKGNKKCAAFLFESAMQLPPHGLQKLRMLSQTCWNCHLLTKVACHTNPAGQTRGALDALNAAVRLRVTTRSLTKGGLFATNGLARLNVPLAQRLPTLFRGRWKSCRSCSGARSTASL